MIVAASARLFSEEDGHDPGIEAYGLQVRIEVNHWEVVVSASPVVEGAWRTQTLDERLPDLMRALALMVELRAGGRRQEAS